MPSGGLSSENLTGHERKPSDEDYGDQYMDTYSRGGTVLQKPDEPEDELPDTTMLDSVILPAIASVRYLMFPMQDRANENVQLFPRVSTQEARVALSSLQRAFTEAERIIPGMTLELVNEIVDSVERVDDDQSDH